MSKKANMNIMNKVHGKLAKYYIDELDSGEELSGGTLAAINTFLKNNDITVDVVEDNPLQNLQLQIQDLIIDEPKLEIENKNLKEA